MYHIAQKFSTDVNAIRAYNQGTDLNTIYLGQVICIPISNMATSQTHITKATLDLNNLLRMLWEQHVYWTRLVILSIVFGLPDIDLVTNRLLRNPKDFAAALRMFYGDAAAAKFENLFTNHLTIAADLVKAAKAGKTTAAADAEKRWYANADQIALFLASINPHWSEQEWRRLLYNHLAMTKNEAVDYLTHNYAESITTFYSIEKEALEMADLMIRGLVQQFLHQFT